ncbi:glycosyltransferase [Paracrocinitomix mangrovi]|uniref:glycosyltransferase family 2 protein n=1 Tax=Paracrocinitomix mangrovi TaxID=2862509 RepID=UPI001C8EA883|nr:glycosyltransferase family 2 protein [Paracrocinitomix mangrovi]UKN02466.1 glycosyltransferase [Paracrocinitomix mangrovi]
MSKPKVSILMSVKNGADYVDQCLDSVLSQDFFEWEMIIVDDNSTDNTIDVLGDFEDKDERFIISNNPGEGIIDALDHAFNLSTGEFITRMDADDIMPVNKIATFYNALNNRKKVIVTGRVKYFSDKGVSEGYVRYENWLNEVVTTESFESQLFRECVVASPNWMVHRSCFEDDFSFSDLVYPEDYDLVFKWIQFGYKLEGINKTTHLWREHEDRTSRNCAYYQQPSFFRLKTARFIDKFSEDIDGVQLIGKGQKGKLIADLLTEAGVAFKWYDLKPTEGKHQSVLDLEKRLTILSNWPTDEKTQLDISKFLKRKELVFGQNLWLF